MAAELLAGVAAGRREVVPGTMGKVTHLAKRLFPGLLWYIADGALKKARRRSPGGPSAA